MKQKIIHEALNGIDVEMVDKVEKLRSAKRPSLSLFIKIGAAAACVSLAALALFGVLKKSPSDNIKPDNSIIGTKIYTGDNSANSDMPESSDKKWEERTVNERYGTLLFNEYQYSSKTSASEGDEIPDGKLADFIGEYDLRGVNMELEGDDKIVYTTGRVFAIDGIKSDCAVAVKFEGYGGNFVYINSAYIAETLGEFIDAMSLDENMLFGPVDYYYEPDVSVLSAIEYDGVDGKVIRELLHDSRDAKADDINKDTLAASIRISVDIPLLGHRNHSIWLNDEGYLTTNILNSGKIFFIGEERAKQFKEYVINNYQGYELVYPNGSDKEHIDIQEID